MDFIQASSGNYLLQPALIDKHRETIAGLSSTILWLNDIMFFQKMLDGTAHLFTLLADQKMVLHFQGVFVHYHTEVIWDFREKLLAHELLLANMMRAREVSDHTYYREHDVLMSQLSEFSTTFGEMKSDFFKFIEKLK